MENIFKETFRIRAYEINPKGRAGIQTICNYLQEIAGNHATVLGVGVEQLFPRGFTWVLSRLHVKIDRYPSWRENITITTWPSMLDGMFALRDFEIRNVKNDLIGRATTSWMLLDIQKRKPVPMPDFIAAIPLPQMDPVLSHKFDKLAVLQKTDLECSFTVRLSDLDINGHVNNVTFIEWAIEAVPQKIQRSHFPGELQISFRAESRYGDRIISKIERNEAAGESIRFIHSLCREKDGKEVATALTVWRAD